MCTLELIKYYLVFLVKYSDWLRGSTGSMFMNLETLVTSARQRGVTTIHSTGTMETQLQMYDMNC